MFGNKLRAWMEAVRPKKKQHRKEKQAKNAENIINSERPNNTHHPSVTWKNISKNSEKVEEPSSNNKESLSSCSYSKSKKEKLNEPPPPPTSRYSANNLSSPESAYSTGYSTDGTSPGGIPSLPSVDYLAKSRQLNKNDKGILKALPSSAPIKQINPHLPCTSRTAIQYLEQAANNNLPSVEETDGSPVSFFNSKLSNNNSEPAGLISPRQRNRIRTNPWLPGGSNSNISSPIPNRPSSEINKATPMVYRKIRNSPIQYRYFQGSTAAVNMQRRSLSSSSCSSVSAGLNTNCRFPRCSSLSDEDDCTLNEMMGKYDESYIYEKETDILSDSDPTDCESDIDTGQDGGDEEDNGDEEFDFIDNGSYIDLANKVDYNNTGHCMYILSSEIHQRKRSSSSKRRTQRRSTNNKSSENKRRRSGSNRKSQKLLKHSSLHQDGSKSAGATPVSMRKSDNNNCTVQKLLHEELFFKKRSNSVCFQRDVGILIDKRDREDDIKYRELIGQAEQIIRTMNINGLSPRRVPGPANKRVELLKSAECASNNKPEVLFNNKTFNNNNEDIIPSSSSSSVPNSNNIIIAPSTPSITFKNSTRFSPKKNHITNFIINNSPVLIKKELTSPLVVRKLPQHHHHHELPNKETITFKKVPPKIKSILHKTTTEPPSTSSQLLISPRHRRESECPYGSSSSSEDETFEKSKKILSKSCPLSEPMRRKVYYGRNTLNFNKTHNQGKTVAFNLNKEVLSSENLRHQVLLNTIQTLKKNLEDHSATLQQTYYHNNY